MSYRQFEHCADSAESISCILALPTDNRELHHRDVPRSNTTTDITTTPLIVTGSASVSSSDSRRTKKTQTPGLASLIERVGDGDEEAFSAVYDQLAPALNHSVKNATTTALTPATKSQRPPTPNMFVAQSRGCRSNNAT
jgi:hypothetical protein